MTLVQRFLMSAYPVILSAAFLAGCENGTPPVPARTAAPESTASQQPPVRWDADDILLRRDWEAALEYASLYSEEDRHEPYPHRNGWYLDVEHGSAEHKIIQEMLADRYRGTDEFLSRLFLPAFADETLDDILDRAAAVQDFRSVSEILWDPSQRWKTIDVDTPRFRAATAWLAAKPQEYYNVTPLKLSDEARAQMLSQAIDLGHAEAIDDLLAMGARLRDVAPAVREAALQRALDEGKMKIAADILTDTREEIAEKSVYFEALSALVTSDKSDSLGTAKIIRSLNLSQGTADGLLAVAAKAENDPSIQALLLRNASITAAQKLLAREGFPAIDGFHRLNSYQAMLNFQATQAPTPAPQP